ALVLRNSPQRRVSPRAERDGAREAAPASPRPPADMTRYWRSGIPAEAAPVRGERRPTEYREGVTRTPAFLAAVASCAVPGLDAVAVRAARDVPGNRSDVGFVTDTQRRAWVVRVPTTPAVGAQL